MTISSTLDRLHAQAKQNRWLWFFSIFNRLALAAGFIPAGIVKLMDERFASGLSANHPMGQYLVALHHTGYYYTFIGVVQVLAAIFLLIPRTVTLGAFLYFPIILNICVLTYAVRFDGSLFTAPLMTLANLYLICWNYEKWKYILPFNRLRVSAAAPETKRMSNKFPTLFFAGVFAAVVICVVGIPSLYRIKPRNTLPQCIKQFKNTNRTVAGANFCDCIHNNGQPLNQCMNEYNKAPDDKIRVP
ncbi:DoxX family protein [Spirosoma soli]|uniref:DoxX family protein n=1 Tax=Spirosoma soli TaxID=1770529 RepID=A0ABW5M4E8_9BACT